MGTVLVKERKDLSGPPRVLQKHADPVRPSINSWCRHMYSVLIFLKCPLSLATGQVLTDCKILTANRVFLAIVTLSVIKFSSHWLQVKS